jgi:hypothetical protein
MDKGIVQRVAQSGSLEPMAAKVIAFDEDAWRGFERGMMAAPWAGA